MLFCVLNPQMSLFLNLAPASSNFKGPIFVCHFYQYRPFLSDSVLHIMNFGAPIVNFIRLETWFYANTTSKYDFLFLFYSPQMCIFSEFSSCISNFEGPNSVCYFYQNGPTLSDGLLHIMNFCAPIAHLIRLKT